MPHSSSKMEPISFVPDEKLSSIDQMDLSALSRALINKPTYKTYKNLLAHHRSLQCLNAKLELRVMNADDAFTEASANRENTVKALTNACNSTASPYPTTCPPVIGNVLQGIIELQRFYQEEKEKVLEECRREQSRVHTFILKTNKRVDKVEKALVKRFGIPTIDDEGNPMNMQTVERAIDVMAWIPGCENL